MYPRMRMRIQAEGVLRSSLGALLSVDGGAWKFCHRLNESVCPATQTGDPLERGEVGITVWNQLGQPRKELIMLPVVSTRGWVCLLEHSLRRWLRCHPF